MFENAESLTLKGKALQKLTVGGAVLWEKATGRIPSEFQEVEYISAANNVEAYIDLGFAFDSKALIYITQHITDASVSTYPFGAAENSGTLRCMLSCPYSSKAAFYGSTGSAFISSNATIVTTGANSFVLTIGGGKLHIRNTTNGSSPSTNTTQGDYTMTNNLYLFAQNYNGSPRFGGVRTISEFQYYDKNDELVCDPVPCYRKSDGEIGMYDIVRKLFLTNAGSGTFTKGPDV